MRNQRPELATQVLDALEESIALLDADSLIVGVNDSWRRFAAANDGDCGHYYVGDSYLATCARAAAGGHDDIATALHDGLRSVMSNELDSFSLEYPCHSPVKQRWFIVHITRCMPPAAEAQLVVSHHDITARKLVELALEQAEHELERTNRELQQALIRESAMAQHDELTGLANRRHFFGAAQQLFEIARRYGQPLSAIMLDLDHFKQVNDRHGHQAGDRALQHVADVMRRELRECDLLARYGGEEFVILLPETDEQGARIAAERIRVAIASQALVTGSSEIDLTISAGIAAIKVADDSLERMIGRADQALYQAKHNGRNRCLCFVDTAAPVCRA